MIQAVFILCLALQINAIDLECGMAYIYASEDNREFCAISHVQVKEPINFVNAKTNSYFMVKFYSSVIPIFPKEIFEQFVAVENVLIAGNSIVIIPKDSFRNATALDELDLSKNILEHLESNMFAGAVHLKTLHLDHNRIQTIENDTFAGLKSLQTLYMGFNRLAAIDAKIFSGLEKLKKVWLYFNHLTVVHPMAFAQNDQLTVIDLEGNELNQLELILSSKDLTMLDVSTNRIMELTLRFKANNAVDEVETDVLEIDASENNISSLWIDPRLHPEILSLSQNSIPSFDNITILSSLHKLKIGKNPIGTIRSGQFMNLSSLTLLHMDEINLTLPETPFTGLSDLKSLSFAGNELGRINVEWFSELQTLQELDISDNALTEFDYKNLKLPELRVLFMSGNKFSCNFLREMLASLHSKNIEVLSSSFLHRIFGNQNANIQGIDCVEDKEITPVEITTPLEPLHEKELEEEKHLLMLDKVSQIEMNMAEIEMETVKLEEETANIIHEIIIVKLLVVIVLILIVVKLLITIVDQSYRKIMMQRKTKTQYMHFTDIKTTSTGAIGDEVGEC